MMHFEKLHGGRHGRHRAYGRLPRPAQVDQTVRRHFSSAGCAAKDRRTADELERQVRRIVDRAIKDFREDSEAFGQAK